MAPTSDNRNGKTTVFVRVSRCHDLKRLTKAWSPLHRILPDHHDRTIQRRPPLIKRIPLAPKSGAGFQPNHTAGRAPDRSPSELEDPPSLVQIHKWSRGEICSSCQGLFGFSAKLYPTHGEVGAIPQLLIGTALVQNAVGASPVDVPLPSGNVLQGGVYNRG